MPRSRASARGFAPRKAVSWSWSGFHLPARVAITANGSLLLFTLTPTIAFQQTIERTRGSFAWNTDTPTEDSDQSLVFGMAIVSIEAQAAGIASLPKPIEHPDYPWFVYEPMNSMMVNAVGHAQGPNRTFDSKAKRIIGANEVVVGILENGSSAFGADFVTTGRVLSRVRG